MNKPKSILKRHTTNNGQKKKQLIRINLRNNKTKLYTLDSQEKSYKKYSSPDLPICDNNIYPCKCENTIFDNSEDYQEYMELKKNRNISTHYKTRKIHYSEIYKYLKNAGSLGKSIPKENRLYDPYTGKIYDKTTLRFGDKLLVDY